MAAPTSPVVAGLLTVPPVRPEVSAPNEAARTRPSCKEARGVAGPFADALAEAVQGGGADVVFSAHAMRRLESRSIALGRDDVYRIASAVDEAAAKGAQESLVLMDGLALVVSIRNRTVITAMPTGEAGANVFTKIDSAVVVPRGAAPLETPKETGRSPYGEALAPLSDRSGADNRR